MARGLACRGSEAQTGPVPFAGRDARTYATSRRTPATRAQAAMRGLEDLQAAPLLCAGIIGFRSLRRAEVKPGQRVGLWGFGASAHLALGVLKAWDCKIYVSTRGASHQAMARRLGADWLGDATELPT